MVSLVVGQLNKLLLDGDVCCGSIEESADLLYCDGVEAL